MGEIWDKSVENMKAQAEKWEVSSAGEVYHDDILQSPDMVLARIADLEQRLADAEEANTQLRKALEEIQCEAERPADTVQTMATLLLAITHMAERALSHTPDGGRLRKVEGRRIVCLCGSTRFTSEMLVKQWELTKEGCIVLSWCALPDSYFDGGPTTHVGDQEGVKEIVDEVHKRKIDLATEVFVVDVGGYIGESTTAEIRYALETGKPVTYLEPLLPEKAAALADLEVDDEG